MKGGTDLMETVTLSRETLEYLLKQAYEEGQHRHKMSVLFQDAIPAFKDTMVWPIIESWIK
jgi:hypothetical protein